LVDDTTGDLDAAHKANAENSLRPSKFLRLLERRADEVLDAGFEWKGQRMVIKFRRFTHQQANFFSGLPFAWKAVLNAQLPADAPKHQFTDEELGQFRKFQLEAIKSALADKERWKDFLDDPTNEQLVPALYEGMAVASGMSKEFDEQLEEFLTMSDYGVSYGLMLSMFNKTPSEMALLPESDVKFLQRWALKYSQKLSAQRGT
jgi:hypothetical protein